MAPRAAMSPQVENRLRLLAHMLDDRFRLPGTNMRFGLDGLVGLVPGIGDTATTLVALYIVGEAWRHGVGKSVLARMLANAGIDWAIGLVPVVGDVLDFGFKGNRRNIRLLHRELGLDEPGGPISKASVDRDRPPPVVHSQSEGRSGRRA